MFRKLLFTATTLATFVAPLALAPQVQADWHRVPERHECVHYRVLYRPCSRDAWAVYRVTESRHAARELTATLHCRGYEACFNRF